MKNILVVNVNWMGDVIFSSPIFRALKEHFPQAHISCLGVPRIKDILGAIPQIDEVIVYDEEVKHRSLFAKLKLIGKLREKNFDIAFLLHRSLTRALLVFLAGVPTRVGYDTKNRGIFLTHKIPPLGQGFHRSDEYLHVIESWGIPVKNKKTELAVSDQAKGEIKQILFSHNIHPQDFVVVVNPGGNWDLKRWPQKNFSLLIEHLQQNGDFKIVISGSHEDQGLVQEITATLILEPVILTGKLNLKQLMALMARADVVISADTGPMHLAHSVGAPVIAIFGPTRPEITGPRGNARSFIVQKEVGCNRKACYFLNCPDNTCMQAITVDDVLQAFRQIKN